MKLLPSTSLRTQSETRSVHLNFLLPSCGFFDISRFCSVNSSYPAAPPSSLWATCALPSLGSLGDHIWLRPVGLHIKFSLALGGPGMTLLVWSPLLWCVSLFPCCCPSASACSLFPTAMVLMGLTDHCCDHKSDWLFILYSLFHRTTRTSGPRLGLYRYGGSSILMQRDRSIAIKWDREKSIFYTRTWNSRS